VEGVSSSGVGWCKHYGGAFVGTSLTAMMVVTSLPKGHSPEPGKGGTQKKKKKTWNPLAFSGVYVVVSDHTQGWHGLP